MRPHPLHYVLARLAGQPNRRCDYIRSKRRGEAGNTKGKVDCQQPYICTRIRTDRIVQLTGRCSCCIKWMFSLLRQTLRNTETSVGMQCVGRMTDIVYELLFQVTVT